MANRIEALKRGIGGVGEVAEFLLEDVPVNTTHGIIVKHLTQTLEKVLPSDPHGLLIKALLCAWLNQELQTTGWLWSADPKGGFDRKYLEAGSVREAIVALMAD